jgi:hypothetical protein
MLQKESKDFSLSGYLLFSYDGNAIARSKQRVSAELARGRVIASLREQCYRTKQTTSVSGAGSWSPLASLREQSYKNILKQASFSLQM